MLSATQHCAIPRALVWSHRLVTTFRLLNVSLKSYEVCTNSHARQSYASLVPRPLNLHGSGLGTRLTSTIHCSFGMLTSKCSIGIYLASVLLSQEQLCVRLVVYT